MRARTLVDLRDKPKTLLNLIGVLLAVSAGILDVLTDNSVFFAALYLLPIMLIAWLVGGASVALIASLCGVTWLAADIVSGHIYSHVATTIWEAVMVLCLFLTVGYSMAAIKKIW